MPYLTTAQVRALPNIGADTAKFPDSLITATVSWFEAVFEDATGVAWETRTITETLSGQGGSGLLVSKLFPRSPITAASITTSGVTTALTAAELADLVIYDHGLIARLTLGRWPLGRRNISVTYSYGITTTPPADVIEAAKVAVRDRLLNPDPNRQFSVATEVGVVRNSTPGPKSPFGIQFVDEVVARRSHKVPGVA